MLSSTTRPATPAKPTVRFATTLGIPHPYAGGPYSGRIHQGSAELDHAAFVRPGIECEIAVRLGRDLSRADAPFTMESVAAAIDSYMPAIEVVDERYADWPGTEAPTLIADNFFAAGCILVWVRRSRKAPSRTCPSSPGRRSSMASKQREALVPA